MNTWFRFAFFVVMALAWMALGNHAAAAPWIVGIVFLPLLDDRDRRPK